MRCVIAPICIDNPAGTQGRHSSGKVGNVSRREWPFPRTWDHWPKVGHDPSGRMELSKATASSAHNMAGFN